MFEWAEANSKCSFSILRTFQTTDELQSFLSSTFEVNKVDINKTHNYNDPDDVWQWSLRDMTKVFDKSPQNRQLNRFRSYGCVEGRYEDTKKYYTVALREQPIRDIVNEENRIRFKAGWESCKNLLSVNNKAIESSKETADQTHGTDPDLGIIMWQSVIWSEQNVWIRFC